MAPAWSLILVCCSRILLQAKMIKKTETEKSITLSCYYFYHWWHFKWGRGGFALSGYAYDEVGSHKLCHGKFHSSTACNTFIGFTVGVIFG